MTWRIAALVLLVLVALALHPAAADTASEPEPQYSDLLGSWVRPDSGRHTESTGFGATFIYGSHVSAPFWIEGRLTGALLETGDNAGTDFYHYGGVYAICVGEP